MRIYASLLIIYPQRMTRFCSNLFLDARKSFQEQEKKRIEAVISYVSIMFFCLIISELIGYLGSKDCKGVQVLP